MGAYCRGFDAHNHLDDPSFDGMRFEACQRARNGGVQSWMIAGADPQNWDRALRCAEETKGFAVLGIHPWWTMNLNEVQLESEMSRLEQRRTPWGIGEIGLDYHRAKSEEQRVGQRAAFRAQLELARQHQLPVVMHCVRAHSDLLQILQRDGVTGGLIHGWAGGAELASQFVALNIHLSFGSHLARSSKAQRSLAEIPLERVLLETDCPDLPLPGITDWQPAHLVDIAHHAATILGASVEDMLGATGRNAWRLFGIDDQGELQ